MKTRTIFSFFKVLVFVRINSGFVDAGFPVWFMISYLIFVRKRYILEGLNHRLLRNPWVNVLFLAHILRYLFGFEYNCALMCTRSSTSRIYFPPLLSRMSKVVSHYSIQQLHGAALKFLSLLWYIHKNICLGTVTFWEKVLSFHKNHCTQ